MLCYSILNLLPCLFLSMNRKEKIADIPHFQSPGHTFSKGTESGNERPT